MGTEHSSSSSLCDAPTWGLQASRLLPAATSLPSAEIRRLAAAPCNDELTNRTEKRKLRRSLPPIPRARPRTISRGWRSASNGSDRNCVEAQRIQIRRTREGLQSLCCEMAKLAAAFEEDSEQVTHTDASRVFTKCRTRTFCFLSPEELFLAIP